MAAPVYDFDDDEKNEPVGFQQDPDSDDFGDGYFTYSDGTRKYASDPDSAGKLSAAGKTTPADQGTAPPDAAPDAATDAPPENAAAQDAQEPPAPPGTRLSYAGDTDSPYANAVAANEGATGSAATGSVSPEEKAKITASPEELAKLEATMAASNRLATAAPAPGAPPVTAPAPMGPPASPAPPAPGALPEAENRRGQTSSDSSSQTQGQHAESTQSKSTSGSVSRTGQALSPEEFAATQAATGGAYDRAAASSKSAYEQQAQIVAAHAAALQQDAKAREAAAAAAIAQRDQRAQVATQKIKEVSSRKTDVNQIWKDKGALGTLLGGIGVAMGSLYATRRGGPNTALQSIETQKQQAIKQQLDDRDSELRGLERELGSLDAAVPVYEARMNDAIKQRIEGMMGDEKSAAVRTNGTDLMNKLDLEKTQKLSDALKAYHGTLATQQANTTGATATQGSQGSLTMGRTNGTEASDVYQNPKATGVDADKRDTDQGKAAAVIAAGDRFGKSQGLQRDKNGEWVKGGPEAKAGTDAEKKAAAAAYAAALTESGYKPEAAEDAASIPGDNRTFWNPQKPEDLAATLNAHEGPLRERMNSADRQRTRAIPLPKVKP